MLAERNGKDDPLIFNESRKFVVLNGFNRDDLSEPEEIVAVDEEAELEVDSIGDGIRVVRYRLSGTRNDVVREQK